MKIWEIQKTAFAETKNQAKEAETEPETEKTARKTYGSSRTVRECAFSLLEYRDRTEWELGQKLRERGYAADEIEQTVLFLKECRYLDDEAYAGRYVRSHASKKSRRQIRFDLEQKGISREIVELTLQEEEVDEDSQIRKLLLKKGWEPEKRLEPAEYRRIMGALARRGFSSEAIRKVMSE